MGPVLRAPIEFGVILTLARFLLNEREMPGKMISLQDFQFASFEQKCDVVTCYSNFLSVRQLGDCKVYLYHTDRFFIEVYYASNHKKVLMINAFDDSWSLDHYAEVVSLSDLNF